MLHKLTELTGGDEERMKIYISTFLEDVPPLAAQLEDHIDSQNIDQIMYTAHVLKPMLSMMGFDDIYREADQLESSIKMRFETAQILEASNDFHKQLHSAITLLQENL